jgi:HD superfamily phosphohydrolase
MSDLRAGRVKDPVHGYVGFTRLERALVDDRVAQRLRYVAQSGLAHLVYPEVRTSRFAHSLGAMHLASRFLEAALRNTDASLKAELQEAARRAILQVSGGYLPDRATVVRDFTADGLRSGGVVDEDARMFFLLAEQGLRLAALVHDLGHLPFSHDFESALERLLNDHADAASRFPVLAEGSGAAHERIGYKAAELLQHRLFADLSEQQALASLVFQIAERILRTDPPEDPDLAVGQLSDQSFWGFLHRLMAGELDVDRCDYLLRDARAYGFEFASYDLDRLVDNLIPVRVRADRGAIDVAIRPHGVSAAESFLLARYRAYQWGPRHHKVAQVAAALQHALRWWLEPAFTTPNTAADRLGFLDDLEAIAASDPAADHEKLKPALARLAGYDDIWMLSKLRELAETVPQDPWLALVTSRAPGPVSLWKRPDQFPAASIADWNDRLPNTDPAAEARFEQAVVDLEQSQNILVVRHRFRPYQPVADDEERPPASALAVATADRGLVPLTELSRLTTSLWDVWRDDVQVQAFAPRAGLVEPQQVTDRLIEATSIP